MKKEELMKKEEKKKESQKKKNKDLYLNLNKKKEICMNKK